MEYDKATPGKPMGSGSFEMLKRMNEGHRPLREWAFNYINWKPEMNILDVGCGGGATIKDMLSLSLGSHITGIDYSPDSVACAKEYLSDESNDSVDIFEGNVSSLPFSDNSFDLVTAVETIYFWPMLSTSLKEIKRVLKDGCPLFIICEADSPEAAKAWGDVHCDMKIYYPEELRDACIEAGFLHAEFIRKGDGYMLVSAF